MKNKVTKIFIATAIVFLSGTAFAHTTNNNGGSGDTYVNPTQNDGQGGNGGTGINNGQGGNGGQGNSIVGGGKGGDVNVSNNIKIQCNNITRLYLDICK